MKKGIILFIAILFILDVSLGDCHLIRVITEGILIGCALIASVHYLQIGLNKRINTSL